MQRFQLNCILLASCVGLFAPSISEANGAPGECLSADEYELFELLNDYRVENGKAPLPASASLSKVAQYHAWDLDTNEPDQGVCNLHSWSDQVPPDVFWTEVCYTPDHAEAQKMWDKPREITENLYTGNGYEIAAFGYATAAEALAGWAGSPSHNDVILNQGIWASRDPWPGIGVGSLGNHWVVWFGDVSDPAGPIEECAATSVAESGGAPGIRTYPILPNPSVGGRSTLRFKLMKNETVDVQIFDSEGRLVRDVLNEDKAAGSHDVHWDGNDNRGESVAPGVYFYRLETVGAQVSQKVVVIP